LYKNKEKTLAGPDATPFISFLFDDERADDWVDGKLSEVTTSICSNRTYISSFFVNVVENRSAGRNVYEK